MSNAKTAELIVMPVGGHFACVQESRIRQGRFGLGPPFRWATILKYQ